MQGDALIDLTDYRFPGRSNIISMLPALVRRGERSGFDIYDYEYLFNDPGTKELIKNGNTIGCFYIESPGMRSLLRRLDVDNFEMLTAASSVIRPGVAESGMMQEFIARHKDPRRRKYLLPEMEKYLGETYGVMIYQEDVIKVAHHIAGLTLEESDLLRRAMSGKMRSSKAMMRIKERFFSSCRDKGLKDNTSKELWRQIESFAGYAFCKSHSASFALLSFQVAYLKVHYPAEFMASVLSNRGGYYSPAVYIQEAKRLGLTVYLPCVNHSKYEYTGSGKELRIGFQAVKNLPYNTAAGIVRERQLRGPYQSFGEFLERTGACYEESKLLVKCGALDCFGESRITLMRWLDLHFKHRNRFGDDGVSLFSGMASGLEEDIRSDYDYSIEQKCLDEMESFDYMVSRHPLEFFPGWLNDPSIIKAKDINLHNGKKIRMTGWYMTSKRIKTKRGEIMKFLSLEDTTGTFEAVLFPESYAKYAVNTLSMGPYVIEGTVDAASGNNIIVEKLELLSSGPLDIKAPVSYEEGVFTGDNEKVTDEDLEMLNKLGREKLIWAYAG